MTLILVTGYVLAHAPLVRPALQWIADLPKTGTQAVLLVTVISLVLAWVNWGFGLVFEKLIGIVPTSDTIFSSYAIWLLVLSLIYVPVMMWLMTPRSAERCRGIEHWLPEAVKEGAGGKTAATGLGDSIADRINNSRILGGLIVIM